MTSMRETMRGLREAVRREAEQRQESLAPKERFRLRDNVVITISGLSGTGKTTVGKMLALLYGVPFEKIGERLRKKAHKQTGEQVIGFPERTPEEDVDLDEITRRHIKRGRSIIIEGRLAGIIAKAERNNILAQGGDASEVFAIIFKAKGKKRFPRIHERLIEEAPTLAEDSSFTVERVAQQTKEREAKDRELWSTSHPEFGKINPFDSKAIRRHGRLADYEYDLYDYVADSNNELIATALAVHSALVKRGIAIKEPVRQVPELPTEGVIFEI